jgi:pyruvate formate lyase activating enzyme
LDNLVREVTKDKAYFDTSGGGVTISGGEPALQSTFAGKFLKALKGRGIQTAFDTCGFYPQKLLERILRYSTVVLFDLKVINSAEHQRLTGHSNETILSNLVYISEFMKTHVHPKTLWIRTPIIPGATDSDENIRDIGRFLSEQVGHSADRWELCAFNNLCKDKYSRLGLSWEFENSELLEEKDMERLASIARASGVDPGIVHWSGSTRIKQATPTPPIDEHPLRSSG